MLLYIFVTGHGIKKRANNRLASQTCPPPGESWGGALRRPRSCPFPLCLPQSNLLSSSVMKLFLNLQSLGRQMLKQSEQPRALCAWPLSRVLISQSDHCPCAQCDSECQAPARQQGSYFLGPRKIENITFLFHSPLGLSVTRGCLYKSPFHRRSKAYRGSNR